MAADVISFGDQARPGGLPPVGKCRRQHENVMGHDLESIRVSCGLRLDGRRLHQSKQ
jgi:hypothetical protein